MVDISTKKNLIQCLRLATELELMLCTPGNKMCLQGSKGKPLVIKRFFARVGVL